MKILILTQYYPPEHGAPQNRLHDLARRWLASGEDVSVLTAMPNYPKGEIFPEYKGKLVFEEKIEGVKVMRSWIFASKKKKTLIQLLSYFSFVFSSMPAGIFKAGKYDYLICESPPLFLGISALILKVLTGAKLVMNISDLWPESAVQLGILKPGPALSFLEFFEKLLYKSSALVSCQTEGIVAGVLKRYNKASTFLFPNGVDPDMFPSIKRDDSIKKEFNMPEGAFIVGYGGNHGRSQALSQVLDAAGLLKNENIFFAIFGDGPEKTELQAKAEKMGLEKLKFYPSQPRQKMSSVQSAWDIAIVPLKNIELFDGARPSKMFELMAGEIPFIFCGKGEGALLAEKSGCVKTVPPEAPEKLAETIMELKKAGLQERLDMGKRGRKFVLENFDRSKLAGIFLEKLK